MQWLTLKLTTVFSPLLAATGKRGRKAGERLSLADLPAPSPPAGGAGRGARHLGTWNLYRCRYSLLARLPAMASRPAMACESSASVSFLLCFSSGVGVISGEGRRSLLLLLAVSVDVTGGAVIHGGLLVRLDLLYLLACGVELWSSPLLGSLSGWPASSSSTILDFFPAPRRRIQFSRRHLLGETASSSWNKVLQTSLFFVGVYSGAGVGSVSCTGVWFFFLGIASGVFAGFGVAAWCSGKVEAGGRGAESGEPTIDVRSSRISCSFPKLGVRSLISKGEDGWLRFRCVAHDLVKYRRQAPLRKTMNSGGEDLVLIFCYSGAFLQERNVLCSLS